MRALAGTVLTRTGWVNGHVLVEAGRVIEVVPRPFPGEPAARGTIVPGFVDAHTHLGDAVARGSALPERLEEAVKPPHGYKHRVLAATPPAELVEGMRGALREVDDSGAWAAVDFREGGLPGLAQLREAARGQPVRVRAYARPATMALDEAEARALLAQADGLGLSSLPDDPRAPAMAELARKAGKGFALHASEGAREPLGPVLDLQPDVLVHLTFADRGELGRVRDAGCAVVVCPRSNARWVHKTPDVRAMLDLGILPGLGTDNAMLGRCDVLAEARGLLALDPRVRPEEALAMLCFGGARAARSVEPLTLGAPAELLVFASAHARPEADVLGHDARLLHRERAA